MSLCIHWDLICHCAYTVFELNEVIAHEFDLNDVIAHILDLNDVITHILDVSFMVTSLHTYSI